MALPVETQVKYWGIAAAVFLAVMWALGDVILPFVLGAALAYCLDPIADWLENHGFSRGWATGIITFFATLVFFLAAILILPLLAGQAAELVATMPEILTGLQAFLTERFPAIADPDSSVRRALDTVADTIQSRGAQLLNAVLASVSGLVNVIVLFVIVPVVAFYLLYDWDNMVEKVDGLLPRDHAPVIRDLARQIDRTMAGFVRGQGTVCLILGIYYAVALMLVGLNFGLIVGFIAGALTFIPYVGALVGGALAIGLALFQFWGDWLWIVVIWAIFQSGQLVEGNVLTPKLVGSSVGLHPVWLIFALSAFGAMFGFVGLLVAVPVAAMIGVLIRFGITQYKDSRLYKGLAEKDPD